MTLVLRPILSIVMHASLTSYLFLAIFPFHWTFLDPKNVSLLPQLGRHPACQVNARHGRFKLMRELDPTTVVMMTEEDQVYLFTFGQKLQNDHQKLTSVSRHQFKTCTTEKAVVSLASLLRAWEIKHMFGIMDASAGLSREDVSGYFAALSISADIHSIADSSAVNEQQLLISLVETQIGHIYIIMLCNVENSLRLIKLAERLQLFKMAKFSWISVLKSKDLHIWRDINTGSSQVTILGLNNDRNPVVAIIDVFYSLQTNQSEHLQIGKWTYAKGTEFYSSRNEINSKHGLNGRVIRFAGTPEAPFVMVDNESSKITGYLLDIVVSLSQQLNFTYSITMVSDGGSYGMEVEPNIFNGIVGYLQRKEVDVSLSQLGFSVPRAKVLRHLPPVIDAYADFFLLQPSMATSLGYLLPFSVNVWILFAVMAIVMTFALASIELLTPHPSGVSNTKDGVVTHRNAYWILTVGFMDDIFQSPNGPAVRILLGTLLFGSLLIFVHYTSTFTSFLAADDVKFPFTTMEEAVANSNWDLAVLQNTLIIEVLKNSKDGVYLDFWQKLASKNFKGIVSSKEEAMHKMSTEKYAFFTMVPDMKYQIREQCSIIDLNKKKYFKAKYGTATRKDFPYFTLFTSTLQRFQEIGLIHRLPQKYFPKGNPYCAKQQKTVSFTLPQVSILLFFLLGSYASSLIVLLVENLLKNRARKE